MAQALYRKYRPQVFSEVVGQDSIARTLKNAIAQDKVSHAYLFTGPRGTGKTTTARLLAKALLCEHGPTPDPDGTCTDCQLIAAGEHPDVYELDAASRTGVDNVREEIIGRVQFAPTRGRRKIYIIDEVHMLSVAAFNALLKTLEEPPDHVVFVMCTTDPKKVPETIQSRCQRFDFRRISAEGIVSNLGAVCVAEGVEFEGEALDLIANRSQGGMRNALTTLEQLIAFGNGHVTLKAAEEMLGSLEVSDMAQIVDAIGRRDVAGCFGWVSTYVESGADLAQFANDLAQHVRNMYVMQIAGSDIPLEMDEAVRRELLHQLPMFGVDRLARLLDTLGDLCAELRTSTNPRLSFEIALTRMVRPEADLTLEALAERVERLEREGVQIAAAPAAAAVGTAAGMAAGTASGVAAMPAAEPAATSASDPVARPAVDRAAEPAIEAVASVSAARSGAPVSLADAEGVQRAWQQVLSIMQKKSPAYSALFLNTQIAASPDGKGIDIEFAQENAFAFKAAQNANVREALAEAVGTSFGCEVPFEYRQVATVASAQRPASKPEPTPEPEPVPEPESKLEPAPEREWKPEPQPSSSSAMRPAANMDDDPYPDAPPWEPGPYFDEDFAIPAELTARKEASEPIKPTEVAEPTEQPARQAKPAKSAEPAGQAGSTGQVEQPEPTAPAALVEPLTAASDGAASKGTPDEPSDDAMQSFFASFGEGIVVEEIDETYR